MSRRRRFLIWSVVLVAVAIFVNWPRAYLGSLKSFMVWAGLPWPFAYWDSGHLEWFDPIALAADAALAIAVIVSVSWLCAWSTGMAPDSANTAEPITAPDQNLRGT